MSTFWPKRDEQGRHIVEQPRADVADELESGKLSYDCIYCCDTGVSIDEYGEEITCECKE